MANIDVEMGQFQKVTTLENKDYIVVSLDNGTQGQIKVSDLASVVAGCFNKYNWMAQNILLDGGTIYKIASNSVEWFRRGTAFICNNDPSGNGLSIVKAMLMSKSTSSNTVSITYIGSDISQLFTFGYIQNQRQIDIYMQVNLNIGTNVGIHALGFSVIEKTSLTELTNIITPTKIL